jgi:arylsulfatase A
MIYTSTQRYSIQAKMTTFHLFLLLVILIYVYSDSLHPRRPATEEEFLKLGHHERTKDYHEMNHKLNALHEKRHWKAWNLNNSLVEERYKVFLQNYKLQNPLKRKRPPNILIIFADDLGYGDLSVQPFVKDLDSSTWPCCEGGILTPNLERMAQKGTIATNFHSASPVCSPSRVAMMTGLHSWRLGALNAFELGRDLSQRNGFLPQIYATIPEIFRDQGYKTLHSGKWHLGGMREEYRVDRVYHDKCTYPSPNQAGFDEYCSELDGPESPRYTFLLRNSILHSQGHRHLLKDDIPMPMIDNPPDQQNVLSDHEAGNAIRYIKYHQKYFPEQPWYIQVWFNAPHGPWEVLNSGQEVYNERYGKSHDYWEKYSCTKDEKLVDQQRWQYKTMVSAMDRSIGKLLTTIEELGLEDDTLIIFTSDNGPENGAGTPGPYRGGKRSLLEGGIRIPAIFQWPGVIPKHSITTAWGAITDIFATVLDAAGINKPVDLHLDSISYLPSLTKAINIDKLITYYQEHHSKEKQKDKEKSSKAYSTSEFQAVLRELNRLEHHSHHHHHHHYEEPKQNLSISPSLDHDNNQYMNSKFGSNGVSLWPGNDLTKERVFLWHYDGDPYDGRESRYQSAAFYHELKIISSNPNVCVDRIYDLRHDPYEQHSLISQPFRCAISMQHFGSDSYKSALDQQIIRKHCQDMPSSSTSTSNLDSCVENYVTSMVARIAIMYPRLVAFVKHGNYAHQEYMNHDKEHVTCDVPSLNQTKRLKYISSEKCLEEYKCSLPEY